MPDIWKKPKSTRLRENKEVDQQRRCQTQESEQLRSDMVIFHAASSSALMVVYSA